MFDEGNHSININILYLIHSITMFNSLVVDKIVKQIKFDFSSIYAL